eukprot:TRINITY_DN1098_c0_g1_i2.p1 TRINITY_DN1098_c0_g1~~TRINITY_DN1098_c0_g1_i2.p1  ORF type:complete len:206 (-),score=-1.70 TRINITY_DN1098_c0_g1_i2:18-635(-)
MKVSEKILPPRRMQEYVEECNNEPICKICRCGTEEGCDFITPCLCKGSLKYVHMSCLNIWRSKSSNSSNYYRCSECHAQYTHLTGLSYLYTVMPRIVYCINGRFMFSYICSIFIIGAIFWTIGSLSVMIDSDFETDNHILNSYFKGLFKRVWDGIFVLGSCVILVYVFNLTTSTLHQVYHKLVTDEPLNIRGVIFLVLMVCLMLI